MSGVITAVVGTSLVSGMMASDAAQSAADTQAGAATSASNAQLAATQQSNALQYQMYLQQMQNQAPAMKGGNLALAAIEGGLGLAGNNGNTNPVGNQYYSQGAPNTNSAGNNSIFNSSVNTAGSGQGIPVSAPSGGSAGGGGPTTTANNPSSVNIPLIGNVSPQNYGASSQDMASAANAYNGVFTQTFDPSKVALDPSYQFRLQQGQQALQSSAAARGGLLTGQGAKDINDYAQGAASTEYQSAYDRFMNNQNTLYNRLAGVAGIGQTANTVAGQAGQSTGANMANTGMAGVGASNNYLTQGASAQAQGQLGSAGAWSNALNSGVKGLSGSGIFGSSPASTAGSVPWSTASQNFSSMPFDQINASSSLF